MSAFSFANKLNILSLQGFCYHFTAIFFIIVLSLWKNTFVSICKILPLDHKRGPTHSPSPKLGVISNTQSAMPKCHLPNTIRTHTDQTHNTPPSVPQCGGAPGQVQDMLTTIALNAIAKRDQAFNSISQK